MAEDLFFSGEIVSIFFSNPANFYKVLLLQIADTNSDYGDSEIVATGTIGDVIEGESYIFHGNLTAHPKYGDQLAVTSYEKQQPTSTAGLVKFFASDHFPGVGKATAEKIVAAYPDDTINSILRDPSALTGILTLAKRNSFIKRLTENAGQDRLLADLSKYGLPANVNLRIIEAYHEEALRIVETTPYQLVEDIQGVGFKLADMIATQLGIAPDDEGRLRAGLLHTVSAQSLATGDTYLFREELLTLTKNLLETARQAEIENAALDAQLTSLIDGEKLQEEDGRIFENTLYFAEKSIQESLSALTKADNAAQADKKKIDAAIFRAEKKLKIQYDSSQKEAIEKAIQQNFSLLTGGPGTGKTTIIQGLIEVYADLHSIDLNPAHYTDEIFPIVLAAPTGRAARRMNEVTALPAATLHRQLGIGTDDAALDPANDLAGNLLIVDEFSMVDTWLAAKLFMAIPSDMKVVLVGDADQLPSVGPGQVFTDLFKLTGLAKTRLERIYRQSNDSTIIDLAHSIKEGQLPSDFTSRQPDRSYFPADSTAVPMLVEQIAASWKKRGNDPFELQVLAPMYKGQAGIDHLNQVLQEVFNPLADRQEFAFKNLTFRVTDKVLHLVNDNELSVFNGDLGEITDLVAAKYTDSKQDELIMDFDGTEVIYPRAEWYKVTLAYAMSIHKSQGSEFQTVVLPLVNNFSRMLQRNLLYTAITRAKNSLILIGEESAFARAVNTVGSNRRTYLVERFGEVPASANKVKKNPVSHILSADSIDSHEIDPLIGLTEKDFEIFASKHEHF